MRVIDSENSKALDRTSDVMWTDTAEFRNPKYHKITDTPETLNYSFLRKVTQQQLLQLLEQTKK